MNRDLRRGAEKGEDGGVSVLAIEPNEQGLRARLALRKNRSVSVLAIEPNEQGLDTGAADHYRIIVSVLAIEPNEQGQSRDPMEAAAELFQCSQSSRMNRDSGFAR